MALYHTAAVCVQMLIWCRGGLVHSFDLLIKMAWQIAWKWDSDGNSTPIIDISRSYVAINRGKGHHCYSSIIDFHPVLSFFWNVSITPCKWCTNLVKDNSRNTYFRKTRGPILYPRTTAIPVWKSSKITGITQGACARVATGSDATVLELGRQVVPLQVTHTKCRLSHCRCYHCAITFATTNGSDIIPRA